MAPYLARMRRKLLNAKSVDKTAGVDRIASAKYPLMQHPVRHSVARRRPSLMVEHVFDLEHDGIADEVFQRFAPFTRRIEQRGKRCARLRQIGFQTRRVHVRRVQHVAQ